MYEGDSDALKQAVAESWFFPAGQLIGLRSAYFYRHNVFLRNRRRRPGNFRVTAPTARSFSIWAKQLTRLDIHGTLLCGRNVSDPGKPE